LRVCQISYLPEERSEEAETFAGDVLGRYYNLDEEENELENE